MADLRPLLRRATGEYESRRAAAEANVVRWEHWSGPAYDPKPFYFERGLKSGLKRGRRLAKASPRGCGYGFDARGRVVVARQPKSDEPAYDEFFAYDKSGIESAAYARDHGHGLRYVTRQQWRGGRAVATDVLDAGAGAEYSERYQYKGGRLVGIEVSSRQGKERDDIKFDLVYEADGELRAIRRYYDYLWAPYPIYWNPARGETLETLREGLRKRLVDAIVRAVAKAKVREPAYCLAIAYDAENDELPPVIGVGLERERREWLAGGASEAKALVWNPAEFSRFEDGTLALDKALESDCEKFLQMVLMKEALGAPRKLLVEVAAELNRRDWRRALPVTDDFVVYAIDLEGADFKGNLKAAVPERKLKALKARRLI